jgi:hypothetical protein
MKRNFEKVGRKWKLKFLMPISPLDLPTTSKISILTIQKEKKSNLILLSRIQWMKEGSFCITNMKDYKYHRLFTLQREKKMTNITFHRK